MWGLGRALVSLSSSVVECRVLWLCHWGATFGDVLKDKCGSRSCYYRVLQGWNMG